MWLDSLDYDGRFRQRWSPGVEGADRMQDSSTFRRVVVSNGTDELLVDLAVDPLPMGVPRSSGSRRRSLSVIESTIAICCGCLTRCLTAGRFATPLNPGQPTLAAQVDGLSFRHIGYGAAQPSSSGAAHVGSERTGASAMRARMANPAAVQ